jgi:PKD repeat protein
MKRILFISILSFLASEVTGQNCMTLFSYGASFETVQFFNQSEMSNAHYWWNFGDGTGSYYENPVHTYPENGRYLVTLSAKDTVSNCSDYHELWLNVTKYSTDTCQPAMSSSLFTSTNNGNTYLELEDQSMNCSGYYFHLDGAGTANFPPGNSITLGDSLWSARYLSRIQYFGYDTTTSYDLRREVYLSVPFNYSSSLNYHDCSANFEFSVVSEDSTGQTVFFKAMNSSALSYDWMITGFGIPIHFYTDTMSFHFPFAYNDMKNIRLTIEDVDGCLNGLTQQLLIRQGMSTTVGFEEQANSISEIQVYPNPFTESATVKFDNPKFKRHKLTLFNTTGQAVKVISNITSGQVTIDRKNLANGIYLYQLQTDIGQTATGKLIVN